MDWDIIKLKLNSVLNFGVTGQVLCTKKHINLIFGLIQVNNSKQKSSEWYGNNK